MHGFSENVLKTCSFTPFVFEIYRAESGTYKNGAINNETPLIRNMSMRVFLGIMSPVLRKITIDSKD